MGGIGTAELVGGAPTAASAAELCWTTAASAACTPATLPSVVTPAVVWITTLT